MAQRILAHVRKMIDDGLLPELAATKESYLAELWYELLGMTNRELKEYAAFFDLT